MKKFIVFLVISMYVSLPLFAQSQQYDIFINRDEGAFSLSQLEQGLKKVSDPTSFEGKLDKGYLLFHYAQAVRRVEDAQIAFDYLNTLYSNDEEFKNPIIFGYSGAAQAFLGDMLTNPIKKLQSLDDGVARIDQAIKSINELEDPYAKGFLYFLRGVTLASVPNFIAISKEAPKTLRTALHYYKQTKLTKENGDILGELYRAYGAYYQNQGKISLAKKNLKKGIEIAYSDLLKKSITEDLNDLK